MAEPQDITLNPDDTVVSLTWAEGVVVTEPTAGRKDTGWVDGDVTDDDTINWPWRESHRWLRALFSRYPKATEGFFTSWLVQNGNGVWANGLNPLEGFLSDGGGVDTKAADVWLDPDDTGAVRVQVSVTQASPHTFPASRDTYVFVPIDMIAPPVVTEPELTFTDVPLGDPAPATPPGHVPVWRVETDGTSIVDQEVLVFELPSLKTIGFTSARTVGDVEVGGNLTVAGTSDMTGNVTMGGTLVVTGAVTASTTLGVTGLATLGALDVTADADVGGTLDVTVDANVGGNLDVTGDAVVDGDATVGGVVYNTLRYRSHTSVTAWIQNTYTSLVSDATSGVVPGGGGNVVVFTITDPSTPTESQLLVPDDSILTLTLSVTVSDAAGSNIRNYKFDASFKRIGGTLSTLGDNSANGLDYTLGDAYATFAIVANSIQIACGGNAPIAGTTLRCSYSAKGHVMILN